MRLRGLFSQIPHPGQSTPPFPPDPPYPKLQSSLSCNLTPPPQPPKSLHLFLPSIHPSIPLSWPARLTRLPPHSVAAYQSPAVCFVRLGFLATDNSHDRAPGQRESALHCSSLLCGLIALARATDIHGCYVI